MPGEKHPFYPQYEYSQPPIINGTSDTADDSMANRTPSSPSPAASTSSGSGDGGGWLSGLFGGGASDDVDLDVAVPIVNDTPCPNTCVAAARAFVRSFESRIEAYQRGLQQKSILMKSLPQVDKMLEEEADAKKKEFDTNVAQIRQLHQHLASTYTKESPPPIELQRHYEMLNHATGRSQYAYEQLRWMLGHAVPHPRNRKVQRPPGHFGTQREWLTLFGKCFDYAWPQRRFGEHGEQLFDWYRMELCPLHNATQQALTRVPKVEGSQWREGGFVDDDDEEDEATIENKKDDNVSIDDIMAAQFSDQPIVGDSSDSALPSSPSTPAPAEPPPTFVLGYWSGQIELVSDSSSSGRRTKSSTSITPPPVAGSILVDTPPPTLMTTLRGGQECWQIGPRQGDVTFVCGETEQILTVRENGKCKYEFTFETPLACDQGHLTTLKRELNDYTNWFARKQPKPNEATQSSLQLLLAQHDEL